MGNLRLGGLHITTVNFLENKVVILFVPYGCLLNMNIENGRNQIHIKLRNIRYGINY